MPIYEYEAVDQKAACAKCRNVFEKIQTLGEPPLTKCPACGAAVRKVISAPASLRSHGDFDSRAKAAGFHKLKRLGKGEYEKQY